MMSAFYSIQLSTEYSSLETMRGSVDCRFLLPQIAPQKLEYLKQWMRSKSNIEKILHNRCAWCGVLNEARRCMGDYAYITLSLVHCVFYS